MKLRISRSQKSGGVMGQHVVFCIDARAELTPEEAAAVKKYGLGKEVVYNSQRSKEHLDRLNANLEAGTGREGVLKGIAGFVKSVGNLAMAKLALNITIDGLVKGQHIEAKDMDEMISAEAALRAACERTKDYLAVAATFDGGEEVVEF